MRLWSVHPKYLDAKGLVALWREALLAQKVLRGKTVGYRNHPQLDRFKSKRDPVAAIGRYLVAVYRESLRRGYRFDQTKIFHPTSRVRISVTTGQIDFERNHLLRKLKVRDPSLFRGTRGLQVLDVHPMFRLTEGAVEHWERE